MALPQAELFEDQFPLIRSCPALNEIHLAQDIKDLRIEVKGGAVLHADRIILAARVPSLRVALSGPLGEENSVLRWPIVPLKSGGDDAKSLNVEVLAEKCIGLMKEQFEHFVQTDLFVSLPAETVLTLLRSDNLSVESEEQVIGAIARWVDAGGAADDEKLRVHAPAMLKEVQWQLTSVQCRSRLLDSYPTLQKSNGCLCLMLQVEQWIGAAEKDKPLRPFNIRPRARQTFFFLFGKDEGQDRYSVFRVEAHLQRAERVADMKTRRYTSYSVVGESIFVVGGGCNPVRTDVDEFLVREGRWRQRMPLAVAHWFHAAAVTKVPATAAAAAGEKTLIGVFGGWGGDARLSSCELYDTSQDRWHKLPDLPEKRSGPTAACLPGDSRVFVFGVRDDSSSALASVVFCHLRADWQGQTTSADFWQPAAPMRTARRGLAATPFRGAILVAGGYDDQRKLNVVEMFSLPDPSRPLGQWTELAGMEQPRRCFTLLTSANAVFVLGNEDEPKNTVETLTAPGGSTDVDNDLSSWVWSSMSTMETLEWIVGAASIRV
ncbi:Kelch-like protein 18 [Sparganum proliferum]